jgi:hypothetical protein
MTADHFAKEAQRLLADETFMHALAIVKGDAMIAMVTADANDPIAIIRLQSKVLVIEEVLAELEGAILALPSADQPVP